MPYGHYSTLIFHTLCRGGVLLSGVRTSENQITPGAHLYIASTVSTPSMDEQCPVFQASTRDHNCQKNSAGCFSLSNLNFSLKIPVRKEPQKNKEPQKSVRKNRQHSQIPGGRGRAWKCRGVAGRSKRKRQRVTILANPHMQILLRRSVQPLASVANPRAPGRERS
jgi:hypothetical protein